MSLSRLFFNKKKKLKFISNYISHQLKSHEKLTCLSGGNFVFEKAKCPGRLKIQKSKALAFVILSLA